MSYDSQYVVPVEFLVGIADETRRLTETTELLTPAETLAALKVVERKIEPFLLDKTITSNGTYAADEGYDGFGTVTVAVPVDEEVVNAESVTFYPDEIYPDVAHKIGYNWFAKVVALVQTMIGTVRGMKPAEILANLAKIRFIPQGLAENVVPADVLASDGGGIVPDVSFGVAGNAVPADVFSCVAVGTAAETGE